MAGYPTRVESARRLRIKQRSARFSQAMAGRKLTMVAKLVGLSSSTIHLYANGGMPSAEAGINVARYLGIDLEWWINGEGTPTAVPPSVRVPVRGDQEKAIIYSRTFLERLDRDIGTLFCTYAVGSPMYPTIVRGAELLCSTDCQPIKDGGVYLINLDQGEAIRRVYIKSGNVIEACTDNRLNGPRVDVFTADKVIAEVLWVSHPLRD